MSAFRRIVVLGVVLSVGGIGCGGDKKTASKEPSEAASEVVTEAPSETQTSPRQQTRVAAAESKTTRAAAERSTQALQKEKTAPDDVIRRVVTPWPFGEGPAGDTDRDGVVDANDRCPNTPVGARVNAAGCPLDEDGDGVPDGIDRCEGTAKGTRVDERGCPVGSDRADVRRKRR